MVRIFDKSKLKPDCENCDALCCVATTFKTPNYDKPPRIACKHLDQVQNRCPIFDRLEEEGFTFCRDFDCYGGGPAVTALFKELGKNWMNAPEIAEVQYHTFSIVYFQLVKYLHPDRAIEIDVPDAIIEELKPFTEQALDKLAATADPFEQ